MEKSRIIFHKLKTVFFYSIASIIIIIALAVSGVRLILTTANLYQEEVEQLASGLLEQPVKIGRMDAKLSGLIPTLIFHDVQLLSEKTQKPLFFLTRVDVGLSYEKLVWQQEIIPKQITIRGMDLHVTKTVEGKFKVKGFDLEALNKKDETESNSMLESWLLQQGEIGLEDSRFTWVDEQNKKFVWSFEDVNLLLKKKQERFQLILSSRLPRELGNKINLSLDLNGDIKKPAAWDVKAFIESEGFNLSPLNQYVKSKKINKVKGNADFKLWIDWSNKKFKQLSGDLKLHDLSYQSHKNKEVSLNLITAIFDSRRDEKDRWNVSVDKFNYESDAKVLNESKFSLAFNYKGENIENFDIRANYLKLGTLSKIITDNHLVKQNYENIINHLDLRGEIRDFYISWNKNKLHKIKADFNNFGTNAWDNIPEIAGLSGSVFYEKQEGMILLSANNTVVGFPTLFRENFEFNKLNADIAFSKTREGLFFDTKKLSVKNKEIEAVATTKLWLPTDSSSPHIDLQMYITKGDVSKVSHFLPVTIMDKGLVDWIDKGLLEGTVNKGTVVLNGKLNDFPFDNKEGVFSVEVEASDFTLDYLDGWPKITNAKISGLFTGQGLKMHLFSGNVENNLLYDSYAEIKSFLNAELKLNILAKGSSHTAAQYLVNSPILSESVKIINSMRFSGDVIADVKMNIPLVDEVAKEKPFSYSGSAKFTNSSIYMLDNKIDVTNGSGTLFFSEKGLSSKNLIANIINEKSKLSVSSNLKNKRIIIAASGKMQPGLILKRFKIPGAKNISGKTSFKAKMIIPNSSRKNNKPVLKITGDLLGIKSDFPDFFYKKEKTRNKFNFTTIFSGENKIQFSTDLGKHGSAIIELDQSGKDSFLNKGAISFSKNKAVLPNKNILYIDGAINKVTPGKWIDALDLKKVKRASPFFVNPVIFNLDAVKMFTRKEDESAEESHITDPKKLPVFEGIVKKLYFDDIFLGRLDFKSSKKKYGLHFDEVILSARHMKLFSHGDWSYKRTSHKTEMDFTVSSNDFGSMLDDLDFAGIIRKGTAQSSGKLKWWGSPAQYALKKLNGNVQLKIAKGNIKEVDAGVGRLLGLFSLSALPRKLFGDFNDAFKSGFSFDVAEGAISIEDGDAYVDDFEIKSPVAEVYISGRTGLADRDYEKTVEVIPDVGGGLAGVTALLVNLPAGIGLWLVDKITGKQFNEASSKIYEISGSWESPEIEEVDEK